MTYGVSGAQPGRSRWSRLISVFAAIAVVATGMVGATVPNSAAAANPAAFDPGYIISDSQFYDGNAMSQGEIQSFLVSRINAVGGCTNALCLANLRTNTSNRAASSSRNGVFCNAYPGAANESASTVIFKVQRACGISAKVILVTLQKEQGLITNRSPTAGRLERAMGYGCPDNTGGTCSSQFYGFFNQVYAAAKQFVVYKVAPFGYFQPGVKTVQYKPYSSCGTTDLNIRNHATAALYNYTPYRPNAAAMANLYSTGDGCSSYGNRNFWRDYSDWFGDPQTGLDGSPFIAETYNRSGGASGPLGAVVGFVSHVSTRNGGGSIQGYRNGAIAWSPATGAQVLLSGPLRTEYSRLGGVNGNLGWPKGSAGRIASWGGGQVQAFQYGAIASSNAGGTHAISGALRAGFGAAGGIAGTPGWPTADQVCNGARYCSQSFQGGTVYSSSVGGFFVPPEINVAYARAGGVAGELGPPVGAAGSLAANGGGVVQGFRNGAVAWSPSRGAFVVSGAIRSGFGAAGGIAGIPGWPMADRVCTGGMDCSQVFQRGTVYSSSAGGFFVPPEIASGYTRVGGVSGVMGSPVGSASTEAANGGGLIQGFENGAIAWSAAGGAHPVSGGVRLALSRSGGIAGPIGWPFTDQICATANSCSQVFQGGTLTSGQ